MSSARHNFDEIIERRNTGSLKWDVLEERFGSRDLLPLWVADMDFRGPPAVTEAMSARARDGIYGYMTVPSSYYDSVESWFMRRHGWNLAKEWIVCAPGVVPSINFAIQALTRAGDGVIVQPPVYYPFFRSIENNGRTVLNNELKYANGHYEMDFDDLKEKASRPESQLMILCSPHNPIGRVWTREELQRLGDICMDNGVTVVSDEIHSDLVYPGFRHTNFASISEKFAQNSITCTSVTKTFNLAGLQVSNIVIPNSRIREDFVAAAEASIEFMPNSFATDAVIASYGQGEEWLEALLAYLSENLSFMRKFLGEHLPGVKMIEPEGTYLVWLDFREIEPDPMKLERLMRKGAGVALDEGYIFGSGGAGFERINIACPRAILKKALEQIASAVASHSE